jgi:hypothetical protein
MSQLRLQIYVNGELTDPTSVKLGNNGDDYGVRRKDDLDIVEDVDLDLDKISKGTYTYDIVDPEEDIEYEWAVKTVYETNTYYVVGSMTGGTDATGAATVVLPNTTGHYTSQAEVLRTMGTMAEQLLMEDVTTKSLMWEDLLEEADDTIKMYVMQHYNPATLYSNKWIRRRATILVAHIMSARRANPPVYTSRVDRVYDELNMIRDNRFRIPGAVVRHFQGPIVRNYMVQNAFLTHPLRVESSKSTSAGNYTGEDIAVEPYVYYGFFM